MNRRKFLQALGAGVVAWGSGVPSAHASSDRVLVLVFMRGGWDGLNVLVPHGEDIYYSLRPTIAVRPPSEGGDSAALDLDGFFGLHPAMSGIWNLYQDGWVAAMPAVHYANSSRSHFDSQDVIETAGSPVLQTGWLARYFWSSGGALPERALSFGTSSPASFKGLSNPVSAYGDLTNLVLATTLDDQRLFADTLEESYAWPANARNPNGSKLQAIGARLKSEEEALFAIGQQAAASGASYPQSSFGKQLAQAAALVKVRAGLEVITLNYGGWDTHSNEGPDRNGRMGSKLADFSAAVEAFFIDLGASASRVTLLTATEFGRTAAENGSKGTDHGNASTWLAIGPNVRGGIHLGSGWPGLTATQLVDGRALAHSVDFRSVYANVLTKFLGAGSTSGILPAFPPDGLDIFG